MAAPAPPLISQRVGRRLALWTALVSLAGAALIFAIVLPLERAAVERAQVAQVSLLAETVATGYEVVDEATRRHPTRELLPQVARTDDVQFVEVTDHVGIVKRATRDGLVGGSREVKDRLRTFGVEDDALVVAYNIPWTQSCVGCHQSARDPVGVVRIGVDGQSGVSSIEKFHVAGGLLLLGVVGVLVLLVLLFTDRFITRPITQLAGVMKRAEAGDVLVRAPEGRDDEVGALARGFNSMLRAMTDMKATEIEREEDLAAAHRELEFKEKIEKIAAELQSSNAELEGRVRAQNLLMEAAHRFGSTLHLEEIVERLGNLIDEQLEWEDWAIFLVDNDQSKEPLLSCAAAGGRADCETMRAAVFRVGEAITGFVADTGAPFVSEDLSDEARMPATPVKTGPIQDGALMAVPMLHKGTVVGVLDFFTDDAGLFSEELKPVLQALAAQAAMAVVNAQLYEATHELSLTDPLTRLMNRRALERRIDVELVRAKRFNHPLALIMVDVDHFKRYNDRMGHLLGDDALRAVAEALVGSVRAVDTVARYGGEEFSVLLPRTDQADALEVCEKLRTSIHDIDIPGGDAQPLGKMSVSMGLAIFPDHLPVAFESSAPEALIDQADKALYRAKDDGRDRVVAAEGPPDEADRVLAPDAEITDGAASASDGEEE